MQPYLRYFSNVLFCNQLTSPSWGVCITLIFCQELISEPKTHLGIIWFVTVWKYIHTWCEIWCSLVEIPSSLLRRILFGMMMLYGLGILSRTYLLDGSFRMLLMSMPRSASIKYNKNHYNPSIIHIFQPLGLLAYYSVDKWNRSI